MPPEMTYRPRSSTMNDTYSSAIPSSAAGSRTVYIMRIGRPSTSETTNLLRFGSHQCGIRRGQSAIASSMATKGSTITTGGAVTSRSLAAHAQPDAPGCP
jgi:hypothetical protein